MHDFIFLFGAPGVGKTTVARLLKEKLNIPYVDYDWIRSYHLQKDWNNNSEQERKMSFENLIFIIKNYKKHGFKNVVVGGMRIYDIEKILQIFKEDNFIITTLFVKDDSILKKRVLTETRDSGWRDFKDSIEFNKKIQEELTFPNEHKIDTTTQTPEETANQIVNLLTQQTSD